MTANDAEGVEIIGIPAVCKKSGTLLLGETVPYCTGFFAKRAYLASIIVNNGLEIQEGPCLKLDDPW